MNNANWIMSKRHIWKCRFHVCYQFLDMKIPVEKTLLTFPVCPKHPKIIKIKIDVNFYFHVSLFLSFSWKRFYEDWNLYERFYKTFLRHRKEMWKIKDLYNFSLLFGIGTSRVKVWNLYWLVIKRKEYLQKSFWF